MDAHDESLAAAGKNLSAFEEAINLFYNLSELTIGDDLWFHSGQTSGPYYPAGKRCGVWQDLEDLNDPYFNLYLPTFIHTFLSTVLKTLGHSRRNLPSLYAGTILYPTFESFTRLGQEDSQAVNHIFSNLEAIAVVLDNDDCSVIQDKNVVGQTWLVDVLSAAEKLRYVDVTMSYYGEFQKDPLKLFWSTKTMLWHLSVTNMAIAEDPFPSFLHKNARTLKEITLNSVLLQDNHGELGGNGWGNLLKPFAGMIQIETTQLHADPWGSILPESLNLLLEDPTCAQLLGEGLVNGVWEYEEEKFEDLCRALCLIHDTIPIDYAMRLVGGFASAD
ncbi:MAG: hypothetical protein LQ350_007440 [Teloschistes chrysophthalmus]|nr:MAG: hypothetical protein LQ350_007440 [Niorma chrysophthalma]